MFLDGSSLYLGGYTILFLISFIFLLMILFGVFTYRQIQRFWKNNARKEINCTVATELSKKEQESILQGIEAVAAFRQVNLPKFTDCTIISEHANSSYVHRMIAFDEIQRDIDRQLEFVSGGLFRRRLNESTYNYLKRIKSVGLPLTDNFILRLSFLHEFCRFRTERPFGEKELMEVQELNREFLRILNENHEFTASISLMPVSDKIRLLPN